jgi:ABC-type nitrate/sulfonate/bicarbonate transport system permease component
VNLLNALFSPFTLERRLNIKLLAAGQLIILLGLWSVAPSSIGIPSPLAILSALNELALTKGLLIELGTSAKTITQAILLSALFSSFIAYLTTADIFKATGTVVSSLRFLGFAGITFLFTLWTNSAHDLKLLLLTFGMTVFQTRSAIDIVKSVPLSDIDYARSLGLSGWRLTWEMHVRGRLHEMIDITRQNAAIGWTLLSMVEGITRSEGGIGALLLNSNKNFKIDAVFAIQFTILAYGIFQDYILQWVRRLACPYAELNRSDK